MIDGGTCTLGTIVLSPAEMLDVLVTDEVGLPVPGVRASSLRIYPTMIYGGKAHRRDDGSYERFAWDRPDVVTDAHGMARIAVPSEFGCLVAAGKFPTISTNSTPSRWSAARMPRAPCGSAESRTPLSIAASSIPTGHRCACRSRSTRATHRP